MPITACRPRRSLAEPPCLFNSPQGRLIFCHQPHGLLVRRTNSRLKLTIARELPYSKMQRPACECLATQRATTADSIKIWRREDSKAHSREPLIQLISKQPHQLQWIGSVTLNNKQRTQASKFLSYVLRHEPRTIGLQLDIEGWADIDQLITGAAQAGQFLDRAILRSIVSESEKVRFAISNDGNRIRALQGHSTPQVKQSHREKTPPDILYHGTARRFLHSIMQNGLKPGSRHHVHLEADMETALANGRRYGEAAVLKIECWRMHSDGYRFYQAENGVWLIDFVPAQYLQME